MVVVVVVVLVLVVVLMVVLVVVVSHRASADSPATSHFPAKRETPVTLMLLCLTDIEHHKGVTARPHPCNNLNA